MPHVAEVEPEREQPEERAQEILAFGRPGHRFHVQRVQREERRHGAALPEAPSFRRSKKRIRAFTVCKRRPTRWWPPGVQTEKLNVDHMRQPGERVPVVDVGGGKGPDKAVQGQPPPDDRIIGDIVVVIEADEAVIDHPAVDDQRQNRDNGADQKRPAEVGCMGISS